MRDPSEKKVSLGLKVGLVTVVLVTVVVTAILVYVPWFYVSRNNVKEIVKQINEQIVNGTRSEVKRFFAGTVAAQTTVHDLLAQNVVSIDDVERRDEFSTVFLLANKNFSWVSFGWPNGDFFGVQRTSAERYEVVTSKWKDEDQKAIRRTDYFVVSERAPRLFKSEVSENQYYAPQRAWYQKALQSKDVCWTDVYVFDKSRKPGINAAYALEKDGKLVGVCTIAIELEQISRWLKTITVAVTGTVFIINSRNQLIAFPNDTELTKPVVGSEIPELRLLGQSQNRLLRVADDAMQARGLTAKSIKAVQQLFYTDPKTSLSYFVTLAPIENTESWVAGTVIPESDFMDEIERNTKTILYLVLILITVAGGLAAHLSRSLVVKAETAFAETEEARAEAERQRDRAAGAMEVAEEANRMKSRFLASMSHELRTPLNAIIGYSELLQEGAADVSPDELTADLKRIQGAAKHLLSLINDILDLSKIEAGKMELAFETFDLIPLLGEVISTVRPLVEKNHNKLVSIWAGDLDKINTDPTRLRQILLNLLGNAAKFTENGSISLEVSRTARNGRDVVLFDVSDTGIGLTEPQVQKLFLPFTQADAEVSKKYGGTGLGLVISRRFCQMMGGDITVKSTFGKGTTFMVEIPVTRPEKPLSPEPPKPPA